jgi:hypothetical protein
MPPDLYSDYEATRFTSDPRRASIWHEIIGYLEGVFGIPDSLLELGAGYCDAVNSSRAKRRFATDIRPEFARNAAEGVVTHVGSCTDLSWIEQNRFQWVLASNLFEHLSKDDLVVTLRQVRGSLLAGGSLFVIQPNFRYAYRSYFDDFTHLPEAIMTEISMCDFLRTQGFGIAFSHPRFLPFSMKSRLPAHPFLVRAYLRSPIRPYGAQMLVVARPA